MQIRKILIATTALVCTVLIAYSVLNLLNPPRVSTTRPRIPNIGGQSLDFAKNPIDYTAYQCFLGLFLGSAGILMMSLALWPFSKSRSGNHKDLKFKGKIAGLMAVLLLTIAIPISTIQPVVAERYDWYTGYDEYVPSEYLQPPAFTDWEIQATIRPGDSGKCNNIVWSYVSAQSWPELLAIGHICQDNVFNLIVVYTHNYEYHEIQGPKIRGPYTAHVLGSSNPNRAAFYWQAYCRWGEGESESWHFISPINVGMAELYAVGSTVEYSHLRLSSLFSECYIEAGCYMFPFAIPYGLWQNIIRYETRPLFKVSDSKPLCDGLMSEFYATGGEPTSGPGRNAFWF